MPMFLVEAYTPEGGSAALADARAGARRAAESATRSGPTVLHVRSFLAAEDETCFHLFEAGTADEVARATERAGLHYLRITEVIE